MSATQSTSTTALGGLRVLELSGLYGAYTGKLFADLGASVTLVETSAGSPLRRKPPFIGERRDSQASLPFGYYAAGKASVVLDLSRTHGIDSLVALAAGSDLIILSDHPQADFVHLEALCARFPRLVATAITPFGRTGPYARYTADDLTLLAMGGLLYMGGTESAGPVAAYGEQALHAAEQFAAVASLAAILEAEASGAGELIDVSIQESVVMALENAAQTYDLEGRIRRRASGDSPAGTGIFSCLDGAIYLLAGGIGATGMWANFARWLTSEGVPGGEQFNAPEWLDQAYVQTDAARQRFLAVFEPYARKHTRADLYAAGRLYRVPVAPMSTPGDVLENAQLRSRGFLAEATDILVGRAVQLPGAPYKFSKTPWRRGGGAPALSPGENSRAQAMSQTKER